MLFVKLLEVVLVGLDREGRREGGGGVAGGWLEGVAAAASAGGKVMEAGEGTGKAIIAASTCCPADEGRRRQVLGWRNSVSLVRVIGRNYSCKDERLLGTNLLLTTYCLWKTRRRSRKSRRRVGLAAGIKSDGQRPFLPLLPPPLPPRTSVRTGQVSPPVDIHQQSDVNCGGKALFLHYFTCVALFILIGRLVQGWCFYLIDGEGEGSGGDEMD